MNFSKVAGHKINTQKSLAFLYTNNEKSERAIQESIPFTIATKRIKYLGINLPKEMKEMGLSDYLTCLLRNLYAGQEATVRTGHGWLSNTPLCICTTVFLSIHLLMDI